MLRAWVNTVFVFFHPLFSKPSRTVFENYMNLPNPRIPDLVMQKYATTHSDGLNAISESISQEAAMQKSVKMFSTPTSSAGTESRTLASPEWGPDAPVNWQKSVQLTGIALADFDSGNTCP